MNTSATNTIRRRKIRLKPARKLAWLVDNLPFVVLGLVVLACLALAIYFYESAAVRAHPALSSSPVGASENDGNSVNFK